MATKERTGIEVKALAKGYYGNRLREEGDKFVIEKESDMGSWMEELNPPKKKAPTAKKEDTSDEGDLV